MKVDIVVPRMGESISEAVVGTILKPSGSAVTANDELLELETDKVNQVLYAPKSGVVTWSVSTKDKVKIGQALGSIDTEAAAPQKKAAPTPAPEVPKQPAPAPTPPSKPVPKATARLTKEDFIAEMTAGKKVAAQAPAAPIPPQPTPVVQAPEPQPIGERRETRRKMSQIRQVIAQRLVEVKQNTAMLTTFNEVDLSKVMALREEYKESFTKKHNVRLGLMSFFVKASVAALKEFPNVNSYLDGDEIVHREYYDIGIAVSTDRGLVVPVVRDCDRLTFAGIEGAIEAYAKKAREGSLVADDLRGGSFTITNGGVFGSLFATPILNASQCGILGMHKIVKRPIVINDEIVIRPMMYLALSYDHRLIDGKESVSFLVRVKEALEDPTRLLIDI